MHASRLNSKSMTGWMHNYRVTFHLRSQVLWKKLNNFITFSVSGLSTNLYLLTSAVSAILVSIKANFVPMHDRGPYPNGMWANGCLFSFSSFKNLQCGTLMGCWISELLILYWPFGSEQSWFRPILRGVMNRHNRDNNCTALWKFLTIYFNIPGSLSCYSEFKLNDQLSQWL